MINFNNEKKKLNATRFWPITAIVFMVLFFSSLMVDFQAILDGDQSSLSENDVAAAARVAGVKYNSKEIKLMIKDLDENLTAYHLLRGHKLDNSVFPALDFIPWLSSPTPAVIGSDNLPAPAARGSIEKPATTDCDPSKLLTGKDGEVYYAPLPVLAELIRTRKISSVELTKMYIQRLKKYDPILKCVITITEERAMKQAKKADEEIAAGKYRGPLHGIPWGAKDLLSTKKYKTTWGAVPYKNQIIDMDATVVKRLDNAGAVLVAKLSLGALAWGDVWYGGKTKNPWNTEQGSSGSSAGPASATAAGLVGFSIGTETWGSIVSPSTRCGVTGLRPTYGRVSRYGAMALSWSMDKIGPICRTVEGCAMVFNAIHGPDGKDFTLKDKPFLWNKKENIKTLRIAYLKKEFEKDYKGKKNDQAVLKVFRDMGVTLVPFQLPEFPTSSLAFILSAEAAAAFDELSRSGKDDTMVRQIRNAWPNVFRMGRLIPAVEYIRANRFRTLLIQQMTEKLKHIDVYIAPSFGGDNLLLTNLTGHPAVVVPNGFNEKGSPTSITFTGNLYQEAKVLAVAKAYQEATEFHLKHPHTIKKLKAKK